MEWLLWMGVYVLVGIVLAIVFVRYGKSIRQEDTVDHLFSMMVMWPIMAPVTMACEPDLQRLLYSLFRKGRD